MISKELSQYDLKMEQNKDKEREPIDFSITEDGDTVCEVWGSEPWKDVNITCQHPYQCIDFSDDDEMGECELCGAQCYWCWRYSYDDGYKASDRYIVKWERPDGIGGLVGKHLKQLQEKW